LLTCRRRRNTKKGCIINTTDIIQVLQDSITRVIVKGECMEQQTKYKRKGDCLPLERDDLTAVLHIVIDDLERNGGTQAKYPDTKHGREVFVQNCLAYFKYVDGINQNDDPNTKRMIPDIESLCSWLSISRKTLLMYSRRSDEWEETIDKVKNAICACKKQAGFSGKLPPLLMIFDLSNNFGYKNASTFVAGSDAVIVDTPKQVSLQEIREQARMLGENGKE